MKYRKKPVVIDAVRLSKSYDSVKECLEFMGQKVELSTHICRVKFDEYVDYVLAGHGIVIKTLEGDMKASVGDYIIKGVQGEFYPCKPDIFIQTYEEIEDN